MHTKFNSILGILVVLAITACTSIPVSQDFEQGFNFSALKTFAWRQDSGDWGLLNNDIVDRRIRRAIEDSFTAKQFTLVGAKESQFLISYHLTVTERIDNRAGSVSGSMSMGRHSRSRAGSMSVSTGSQIRTYDRGTLLIDVFDVASNQLVWRGVSSRAVNNLSDTPRVTTQINETVEAVLAQFPPQ